MRITEMTSDECRAFLARTGFGHLGCTRDDEPYVVPIYFTYETDRLYGFSTFGQKVDWMRANPKVCVEVDEITSHSSWKSVIVNGRYQELPDTPQYNPERQKAYALLDKRARWWQIAHATRQLHSPEPFPPIFYCIRVDRMAGRSAAPDDTQSDRPVIRIRD